MGEVFDKGWRLQYEDIRPVVICTCFHFIFNACLNLVDSGIVIKMK